MDEMVRKSSHPTVPQIEIPDIPIFFTQVKTLIREATPTFEENGSPDRR
jgi:hypothetical protein